MTSDNLRKDFERRKGMRDRVRQEIKQTKSRIEELQDRAKNLETAQAIIQAVAQATQKELEYHVGELGTLALSAVFEDPYELSLDFVLKRNNSEAQLRFIRDDKKMHPLNSTGGGGVDVAAFALRPSLWGMMNPKTRPIMVLDEPFKNINDPSRELHAKAAKMVKTVSDRMGMQILIVSLMPELEETADRVFETKKRRGKCLVRQR